MKLTWQGNIFKLQAVWKTDQLLWIFAMVWVLLTCSEINGKLLKVEIVINTMNNHQNWVGCLCHEGDM